MSDSGKAVFLSYASQDAEAAKRVADALRSSGVEVWFDAEGGLEHGDEWDAKIRRQIKECVLFIPVISANTEAREEGYFRIEWDLAAERARGIASGVAFILPVVIDDTREQEALVPDRFRAVQWTRLPGGTVSPEVKQRFLKLWSHRAGVLKQRNTEAGSGEQGAGSGEMEAGRPRPADRTNNQGPITNNRGQRPRWLAFGAAAVFALATAGFWLALRPASGLPPAVSQSNPSPVSSSAPAAVPVTPPPVSPARELVAKALTLIHAIEATREDFLLAEEYCQRALKLDPDEAEAWAAYSQVHSAFGYRGWDTSAQRREQTRVTAERAMRLAPRAVNARLAQAGAWATFGINREEREKLLREVVAEQPDHQEALRFLAVTVLAKPNGLEEALAINERSAAMPGGDPLALFNNARYLWQRGRPAEGYATLQRALAQQKFVSAVILKMVMEINWRGDVAAAEETLRQLPQSVLQEDRANHIAGMIRYYQRDAAGALEIWRAFPRDYHVDFIYEGPKGLLVGLAYELDHREAAARTEWRAALRVVEERIAAAPTKANSYYNQALLLACLGEKAAAEEATRTYEQLAEIKLGPRQPMPLGLARLYARLGRLDEILAHPPLEIPVLRIAPQFEALRADPRFQEMLREKPSPGEKSFEDTKSAAATRESSSAKATEDGSGLASPPNPKSVAVLAFANLSDDKANEYFSDGISEELLNVLAKVPGLKVSARTSAFYFKGKDTPIPEIAKQLGVAYVVEGSVRRQGDKVRITALR
jgi:TolB-like protein